MFEFLISVVVIEQTWCVSGWGDSLSPEQCTCQDLYWLTFDFTKVHPELQRSCLSYRWTYSGSQMGKLCENGHLNVMCLLTAGWPTAQRRSPPSDWWHQRPGNGIGAGRVRPPTVRNTRPPYRCPRNHGADGGFPALCSNHTHRRTDRASAPAERGTAASCPGLPRIHCSTGRRNGCDR